jgi:hypothetical protein
VVVQVSSPCISWRARDYGFPISFNPILNFTPKWLGHVRISRRAIYAAACAKDIASAGGILG